MGFLSEFRNLGFLSPGILSLGILSVGILLAGFLSCGVFVGNPASPDTVKWFSSYVSGRSQSVRIGSSISSPLPITHGVPQGAILSPLLFCIYTNNLPLVTQSCDINSYVGDSKDFVSFAIDNIDQATQNLEADLGRFAKWCSDNQLLINPDKTKLLLIGNR